MNESPRVVRLYGKLGTIFGRVHKLYVKSPAEAIRALSVTLPGFETYLRTAKDRGMEFAVFSGKHNIHQEELGFNGTEEIKIAPVLMGSKKNGMFQTILGVVLIAASFIPGFQFLAAPGVALVAGGIVQMLSPQPKGLSSREATENKPSYAFGGAVNSVALGNPLGILAGERIIGGAIVSAGIYAEDAQ